MVQIHQNQKNQKLKSRQAIPSLLLSISLVLTLIVASPLGQSLLSGMSLMASTTSTTVSGIVNTYAPVTAIVGNDVTIGTTTGAATPFAIGDYALLIQMTGPPPAQAGSNMGNYELLAVTGVSGSTITLSGISSSYSEATEAVQLVRVPYDADGFIVGGAVNAKPWDGSTGGIVSLKGGTLTLNADIDASGTGFTSANSPTTATFTSLSSGAGNPEGRGSDGGEHSSPEGTTTGYAGLGGGGLTGGGVGNTFSMAGGGMGGGGISADGSSAPGTDGGTMMDPWGFFEGSVGAGGGGGIIGGGGGGGGGFYRYKDEFSYYYGGGGGGGGIAGGGGGGAAIGAFTGTEPLMSAGGGGPGGVGTGGNGYFGGTVRQFAGGGDEGSGGGGGGSYGGGGGAGGHASGGDDGSGGGGGGSWAGGGPGGVAGDDNDGDTTLTYDGGDGNTTAGLSPIPASAHYMNDTNPRLMLGGAGGGSGTESSVNLLDGGTGGGIILLEFDAVDGNSNAIRSDGNVGQTPPANTPHSGSGGGGGGQMRLTIQQYNSPTDVVAAGGTGGLGSADAYHGGAAGGGGGGGGIWFDGVQSVADSSNTGGQTLTIPNVDWSVVGGIGGQPITNPKNDGSTAGGGYGGSGFATVEEFIPTNVLIGNRVWIEDDSDGLAATGVITPVIGTTVTARANDGTAYMSITDSNGYYTITVPANMTYTVYLPTPVGYSQSAVLHNSDSDPNNDNDENHNSTGTVVTVGTVDNLTIDFGFTPYANDYCVESTAEGFLDISTIPTTAHTGSGSFNYPDLPLVGHGTVTIDVEKTVGTHNRGTSAIDSDIKKQLWLDQGYGSAQNDALFIEPNSGTITVTYSFADPMGNFDLVLIDLDKGDILYLSAKDSMGSTITDFSAWRFASGDMSNWDGGTSGNVAEPAVWKAANATVTAIDEDDGTNDHRSFASLTPDILITELQIIYPSTGTDGRHTYSTLYGTLLGRDNETCLADVLIGDRVWIEDDNDGDATTGVITPVVGSLVTITATNGMSYTDTTDGNGFYTITVPANATYTVTVDTPADTLPAGTLITSDNDPNSDDNLSHDGSGTVVTVGTEDNLTIDFGFYEPVLAITHTPICPAGALLWVNNIDVNNLSGIYGAPEVDITLVGTVTMSYTLPISLPAAFSGPLDIDISEAVAWSGYLTRSKTVDQPNERYAVLFMKDGNVEWQSPWTGVDGTDDGIEAGLTFDDWTGSLGTASLPNGADEIILIHWSEPTYGTNDTNYNSVTPCSLCIEYSIPTADVMIGDRVWIEDDNDGDAKTGVITPVVGSLVTAIDTDGTVYTDTTDASGYYTISVPANMTYTVSLSTPAGTTPTPLTGGNMITDTVSGDDLSHDGSGTTVVLGTEDNLTVDFGFYTVPLGTPSLALEKTLNTPEPVLVGQSVIFTIRITNTGNVTITTLPLTDTYDITYLVYDSINGSTPATDDNVSDGQLEWTDLTLTEGDLAPGDTLEVIVHFTAVADTTALAAQPPCLTAGASCNVAAVNNAMAGPDPVPPAEDSDDVAIEEVITGKSTLGDFVWYDTNGDGIKDPGEPGINGVIINLYDSTGLITTTVTMSDTGSIGDDTGMTNGDGFYDFQVQASTVYTVEIDPSNYAPGGALEGYGYTGDNANMPYNGDETRVVLMPAVQHDENNVDFSYVAPQFELSKTLNTAPPVRVAERISFTIRITNTGMTVINAVPLTDSYSPAYLDFIDASPEPDNPTPGQLFWHDLTEAGSTGFGMELNPGATFEVIVTFLAKLDTTGQPNDSTLNLAESQSLTDTAEVPIFAPTSVELAMTNVAYQEDNVVLRWETTDESDVAGFHIYRQLGGNEERITTTLLVAQKSGSSSGAVYTYEDKITQAGMDYQYFVGILDTNGLETQKALGHVLTQRTIEDWFIFLPVLMK